MLIITAPPDLSHELEVMHSTSSEPTEDGPAAADPGASNGSLSVTAPLDDNTASMEHTFIPLT